MSKPNAYIEKIITIPFSLIAFLNTNATVSNDANMALAEKAAVGLNGQSGECAFWLA